MIRNRRKKYRPKALIKAESDQELIALSANTDLIKSRVYKGTKIVNGETKHEVRDKLVDIYHGKCAYCESKEFKPEVEHYRPKKRVKEDDSHLGYYWLCYEWSNLLPSCRYCNTEGGKVNSFPISGIRNQDPPINKEGKLVFENCKIQSISLSSEEPLLLNPEIDQPENHLKFNRAGQIIGKGPEKKGEITIEVCNLNRDNLKFHRKRIVDDMLERIIEQFTMFFEDHRDPDVIKSGLNSVFRKLDKLCHESEPFSLMACNIRDDLNGFIGIQIKASDQREFLIKVYQIYRDANPI